MTDRITRTAWSTRRRRLVLLSVLVFVAAGASAVTALAASKTPDFSITSTAHQSVYPGQAGVYTVSITPQNGFSGTVALSVSGLPSGATGTFVTNPVSASTTSTSLIVNVGSSVAQGTYNLTITGMSGSLSHTVSPAPSLAVVPASAFTLSVGSQSPSPVATGSSASFPVSVTRLSGFSGAITFSTNSDLPAGVSASFSPNPTSATGTSSTLTMSVGSSVAPGSYPFAINGLNGGHTTWVRATLVVIAPPDFSLSSSTAPPLYPTDATVFTLSEAPLNGFSGNVSLSVSGLPMATAASFVTNPLTSSKSSTSVIVTAGSSAATGTYTLTFTGTSGSLTHSVTATLTIANPTSFYLTVAPPENAGVAPGSAATFTVTPKRLSGFTGSVTLSMNPDLPPGVTASFSPNPNASGASTLTLQTSASTPQGSYTLAIKGVSGSIVTWDSVVLDIGSFGISVTPASRTVADAGTGHTSLATYSVSLSRNFFSDNVALSVSGLPSGATGSFSPNPIAGPSGTSSTLTVNGGTAAAGTYTLTVSGAGGSPAQTHSQQVQLVIDTVAPTTTIGFPTPGGNYNAVGWASQCSGLITGVCGTASDPNSVTSVKVAIKNSSGQYWNGSSFVPSMTPIFNTASGTTSWSYTFTPPADGAYNASVQATDGLGNTTASGSETTAAFKYDTVAPSTALTTTPVSPDGTNGWFKQASVQFTLNATDSAPSSGVQTSFYKVDGGLFQPYTTAVTISSQGDHTVQYYSQDNAGNIETPPKTTHIKLDNVAPVTTLTVSPSSPSGTGWYTTTPSFTLNATDANSGAYQTYYRIDGGTQTLYGGAVNIPNGQHAISYWSVDVAGNTEAQHTSGTIKVDTVAPSTSLSISPTTPTGTNSWYKGPNPPTITLTGSDGTSGIASTTYEINSGSMQTYTGPFSLPEGSDVVTYRSTDAAGNVEATHTTATYKVDTVPPPAPSITGHPSDPSNQPTAHFAFGDSEGGVSLSCALDNAPLASCASPQDYSALGQGSHSFQVQATDQAGNTSSTSFNWNITAEPYTIGANPIPTLYPGGPASKIELTFHNPNGDTVKVSSVTVSASSVTGGSGSPRACDASDYSVTQLDGSAYPFYIDASGDSSLSSLGIPSGDWPTIRMLDSGNQDGCEGATVHLDFSGNS